MPAGSTFDPFYQNLRTFFSQHTAQTGKQLGLNEMYGLTTGEMATQLAAKRIADQTALERERLALSAGQTAQQLRQQKILEERRLAEMEKTGVSTREAQAWQNRATKQNIEAAPWRTAISGIQALGSAGLAGASWWDRLNYPGGKPAMNLPGDSIDFNTLRTNGEYFSPGEVNPSINWGQGSLYAGVNTPAINLSPYQNNFAMSLPNNRFNTDWSGLDLNVDDWGNSIPTDSGITETPIYTE